MRQRSRMPKRVLLTVISINPYVYRDTTYEDRSQAESFEDHSGLHRPEDQVEFVKVDPEVICQFAEFFLDH